MFNYASWHDLSLALRERVGVREPPGRNVPFAKSALTPAPLPKGEGKDTLPFANSVFAAWRETVFQEIR
ncbi:MAG TPA: hypothetical protein DCZ75_12880 [Geobacter sp.]|nr:hypothetical protein [Geobacter sp.]